MMSDTVQENMVDGGMGENDDNWCAPSVMPLEAGDEGSLLPCIMYRYLYQYYCPYKNVMGYVIIVFCFSPSSHW